MCRSAARSSTARSSASLRSVMSSATPSKCSPLPFSARPRAAIQRTVAVRFRAPGIRRRAPRRSRAPFARRGRAARDPPDAPSRGPRRTRSGVSGKPARSPRIVGRPDPVAGDVPDPHGQPRRARRQVHALLAFLERTRDPMARSPLDEERGDQPGLDEQDRDPDGNRQPIPVPYGRFAKPHVGIGGQQALVDSPAAKCAPVDHGHVDERGPERSPLAACRSAGAPRGRRPGSPGPRRGPYSRRRCRYL